MINFVMYIVFGIIGFTLGVYIVAKKASIKIDDLTKQRDKNQKFFKLMSDWVIKEADGHEIAAFLSRTNCSDIAVYGMGAIGKNLVEVLKKQNIQVQYVIDKRALNLDIPVYRPTDKLPDVDMIINTAILDKDTIKKELKKQCKCEIISIDEII